MPGASFQIGPSVHLPALEDQVEDPPVPSQVLFAWKMFPIVMVINLLILSLDRIAVAVWSFNKIDWVVKLPDTEEVPE
jgi:hypothetical protein